MFIQKYVPVYFFLKKKQLRNKASLAAWIASQSKMHLGEKKTKKKGPGNKSKRDLFFLLLFSVV